MSRKNYLAVEVCLRDQVFFEEGELERIPFKPNFFGFEFSEKQYAKKWLIKILEKGRFWVDNDYILLEGEKFKTRLMNEPAWDWYQEK